MVLIILRGGVGSYITCRLGLNPAVWMSRCR